MEELISKKPTIGWLSTICQSDSEKKKIKNLDKVILYCAQNNVKCYCKKDDKNQYILCYICNNILNENLVPFTCACRKHIVRWVYNDLISDNGFIDPKSLD